MLGIEGELIHLEQQSKIALAVIGCGSHTYRNILPALRFVPDIEISAFCDLNIDKAKAFAKKHGAKYYFSDMHELVAAKCANAVVCVVGFDPVTGHPLYPKIVPSLLRSGIPVWLEKPPASSSQDLEPLLIAAEEGQSFFQCGFKMMFAPAVLKVLDIINSKEFGTVQSFDCSYAVSFPEDIRNLEDPNARRFLDDIVHILSQIQLLFGQPDKMTYYRARGSDATALLFYENGMHGVLRVLGSASTIGPAETFRILGSGLSPAGDNGPILELLNGERVIYHEAGDPGSYGRDISFLRKDGTHTHEWSPNLRKPLGALSLQSLSLYGYISELKSFASSVLSQTPPQVAGSRDTLSIMKMFDAFSANEGESFSLTNKPRLQRLEPRVKILDIYTCSSCANDMHVKDGWTAKCSNCGATMQLLEHQNFEASLDKKSTVNTLLEALAAESEIYSSAVVTVRRTAGINKNRHYRLIFEIQLLKENGDSKKYFGKHLLKDSDYGTSHEYHVIKEKELFPFLIAKPRYLLNEKFLVVNWLEGPTLADVLSLNNNHSLSLVKEIVKGLALFHKARMINATGDTHMGYVHGDLDPWQVIITEEGYKVIDWEDFDESGCQEFDLINFLLLSCLILQKDIPKNILAREFFNLEGQLGTFVLNCLETYAENSQRPLLDMKRLSSLFATNRIERLKRRGRNSQGFIYEHIV